MANDFNDEGFWDGEEEDGYSDESHFPRVWLLAMGVLSVCLVIGVVALAFLALFRPTPTPTPALSPTEGPTLPPPASVPLPEGQTEAEGTSIPTMVQSPPAPSLATPMLVPAVPTEIAIGIYVKVSGTGGGDLSFRANAGTNYARLKVVAEGSILRVLDGPVEADGYVWWQLQDVSDEMVGWAVADYLVPTAP